MFFTSNIKEFVYGNARSFPAVRVHAVKRESVPATAFLLAASSELVALGSQAQALLGEEGTCERETIWRSHK